MGQTQVMVKLVIQREWNNYFLEIYLPSILYVTIAWGSFWIEVTSAPGLYFVFINFRVVDCVFFASVKARVSLGK